MSSDRPSEVFFDRSLGKRSAEILREHGWIVHTIADHYPNDAQNIADEVWIAEGCRRGWILFTKDHKIRYRAEELEALSGHLFCIPSGNLNTQEMADRFILATGAIIHAIGANSVGFWHVYAEGKIKRMWP
ncbi:hypothetical protein [Sinomonas sp. G460-2]|uniref:PIN-like domain-containing protein n=1 Tax=Sinomonas sp. G460-2 TaxID=3393464 RepID=UPI0039EF0874